MFNKKFTAPVVLVIAECVLTGFFYSKNPSVFTLSNHVFFWGIVNFLFSLVLFFGMENRGALSSATSESSAPYEHNAANFIDHTSKKAFDRLTDPSSAALLFIISMVNFVIYFFSM